MKVLSSQIESHWDSTHRLLPCLACDQLFQTEDDIADHLQFEHGTHFLAAPALPAPIWKSAYMAAERRPPTPKVPSQPQSPDSSPCPSPVEDPNEQEPSFAPIERAPDHSYTSGFIAAPRPVRPVAPKSYLKSEATRYLPKTTPGGPRGPRSLLRAPQYGQNFRPNLAPPRRDLVPRIGQQLYPGATLAAVGPQVVTVKDQVQQYHMQIYAYKFILISPGWKRGSKNCRESWSRRCSTDLRGQDCTEGGDDANSAQARSAQTNAPHSTCQS